MARLIEYNYVCTVCDEEVTCMRTMDEHAKGPDEACGYCGAASWSQVIRKPKYKARVKSFILIGDKHWHNTEYTPTRSIK